MKLHPRVTRAGVELVKRFEGYRRTAARLPDGGFVLGYGHTLTAREGAEVSEPDAEALLWFDLSRTAEGVEAALLAPTTAAQFEALTSLAFNIGLEGFTGSTVVRRLNEGAYLQAAAAIELWRRAEFDGDALVVDALVRRRAAEKAHFLSPPEGFAPAPSPVIRPTFDHSVLAAALAWGERGERVVVSAPALDGATAAPSLSDPPGREHGDSAPSACIAAADAVSARLSRILPDAPPAEPAEPAEPAPLVLTPEEPISAPFAETAPAPPPEADTDSGLDLPPPPVTAAPTAPPVFMASAPAPEWIAAPPVRSFAFEPLSPPAPQAAAAAFAPLAAVEAPEAPPAFEPLAPVAADAPNLFQTAPSSDAGVEAAAPVVEEAAKAPAEPVLENPTVFAVLGLVGVALFAGAVVCMFKHPSLLCLLSGLAGVLAMAPAAAFFLFRFIGTPVEAAPADAASDADADLTPDLFADLAPAEAPSAESEPRPAA